ALEQTDIDPFSARMASGVGQGFLHDPVDGVLELAVSSAADALRGLVPRELGANVQTLSCRGSLDEARTSSFEADGGQSRWTQLADQAAQLLELLAELGDGLAGGALELGANSLPQSRSQKNPHSAEALERLVV